MADLRDRSPEFITGPFPKVARVVWLSFRVQAALADMELEQAIDEALRDWCAKRNKGRK